MYEFIPLLLFLAAFLYKDIFFALIVLMIAAPIGLLVKYVKTKTLDKMMFWSVVALYPFGALTLYFRNAEFLFWKPTVICWAFALAFLASLWIGERRPLIQRVIDATGDFPSQHFSAQDWRVLNLVWVGFYAGIGLLNLYVAYSFSLDFWVNFKVFGILGLSLVLALGQVGWIMWKLRGHAPLESED